MTDKSQRGALSKTKASERRIVSAQFEVRSAGEGKLELEGYACVTEAPYEMYDWYGPYLEVVSRGAFGKTLAEGCDVALLMNHGGVTMSRTKSSTLQLTEDEHGLHWKAGVNGTRNDVRDMVAGIEDGDLDECSFAFRVTRQQWSPDYDERRILEVDMDRGDVSVVNYGANPHTSIGAMRAQDFTAYLDGLSGEDLAAAHARLAARLAPTVPGRSLRIALEQ